LQLFFIWRMACRNVVKSKVVELSSMEKLLHPRQEAAQLLSVSLRKIDLLISSKALKTVRVGRRNLVAHSELERFARTGTGGKL
jgi:excisionase family DNA binding protein